MKVKREFISILLFLLILTACARTPGEKAGEGTTAPMTAGTEDNKLNGATPGPEIPGTFYNPISDKSMPDPFIMYHNGYYYGLATEVTTVKLYRCASVEDLFISGESKELIKTGDSIGGGKTLGWNCWAPEIHYVPDTGKWYVYFCASTDGFDFNTMRMHCLESEDGDPFGDYVYKGKTIYDKICIDQTVYYDEDSGHLYTAYCEFTDLGQVIMLADMKDPWKVGKKRVMITYPEYSWEKRGTDESNDGRVNEGPVFLKHDGQIFLLYSASGCWSEWYCLGCLRYKGPDTSADNFLDPANWEKSSRPLFKKGNEVYGVGHCSFFSSPDGAETWVAYHGMATPDAGVEGRYAYIQKLEFGEDGMPVFGDPFPRETAIEVPSGQKDQ